MQTWRWSGVMAWFVMVGCGEGSVAGHLFQVDLTGVADECHEPDESVGETYDYVLVLRGASAEVYIDDTLFANGSLVGCDLTYQSPLYTETREDGSSVRWSVTGDAVVEVGGVTCEGAGDGWAGNETINIVESTDPAVPRGCTYTSTASGSYVGETE